MWLALHSLYLLFPAANSVISLPLDSAPAIPPLPLALLERSALSFSHTHRLLSRL